MVSQISDRRPRGGSIENNKGFSRSANIRRRASLLAKRLPAKSSPHVGWFRHAPTSCSVSGSLRGKSSALRSKTSKEAKDLMQKSLASWNANSNSIYSGGRKDTSSLHMEASPYIGWFRHAPPSEISVLMRQCSPKKQHTETSTPTSSSSSSFVGTGNDAPPRARVDGRLPGGLPLDDRSACRQSSSSVHFPPMTFLDHWASSSFQQHSSQQHMPSNLGILDRLAHWLLYPILSNETTKDSVTALSQDITQSRVGLGVLAFMTPLFSLLLRNVLMLKNGGNGDSMSSSSSSCSYDHVDVSPISSSTSFQDDSDDDDSCCSSKSGVDTLLSSSPLNDLPGGLLSSPQIDVSVSSLAERYYAHEAVKELFGSSSASSSIFSHYGAADAGGAPSPYSSNSTFPSSPSAISLAGVVHNELDLVITQIDIARMVRNASRHLDVESIYSLPTITYISKKKRNASSHSLPEGEVIVEANNEDTTIQKYRRETAVEKEESADLPFSWMFVPDEDDAVIVNASTIEDSADAMNEDTEEVDEGQGDSNEEQSEEEEEEQCVICLERFEEGDRLRVLPCSHLFHVSCIDKWLSGSYSDMECFTSGCPTCKKHPVQCHEVADLGGDTSAQNEPLDGSLPSWAFTQLGDALASSESTA